MKNEKAMCYEKFSIKSKKDGISLIALVITIIVIIIIAAISFSASIGTVEMANYTKIVDNMDKVQVAITEKALDLKGYEAEKGKRRTDGQVYNYVAKGGTTREDFVQIGYEPRYTIIEKDADIGIKLPEIKVNTPDEANVEVTWAVTKDGEIFVWPPYTYKTEKYITKYDKVDESLVGKSGDSDVVIKKKITTITTDDRGRLVNPVVGGSGDNDNPNSGDPSGSGDNPSIVRVKITKPTLQGEYVYTGNIQTADLVNFDPTTMQSIGVTRKNAGTQIITITIKDTTKYEWEDGTTDPLDIEWVMKKQTASVVWGNLSFNYDGTIHIPTASATGENGETINLSVTGGKSETGTHTAVAVAIGDSAINYELINASTTFTIVKSTTDIISLAITLEKTLYTYSGIANEPKAIIIDGDRTLVQDTDYTLSYENNINVGTATVKIVGIENYVGSVTKNFTIERAKSATVTATDKTYNGLLQAGVTGNNVDLTGTISATQVGTYTATATPKANYAWSDGTTAEKTVSWKILTKSSIDITVTLAITTYTYDGAEKEPTVVVKDKEETLVLNKDYEVKYSDNINAGTATVTITLKGNYTGTIVKNFIIERAKSATVTATDKTFDGTVQVSVTGTNVDLTGTVAAKEVGTYTAKATPKSNYAWSDGTTTEKTLTWKILSKESSNLTVTLGTTKYTYSGTAKEPTAKVQDGANTLIEGTDYTVSYVKNINVGNATATITLKGNYTGTITQDFEITAKTISVVWTNTSLEYTENELVPTAVVDSGVEGELLNVSVTGAKTLPGTYTATASLDSVVGGQAKVDNYTLINTSTEFEITKGLMVGDYVNYAPTSSTYETDKSKTGYNNSETLTTVANTKWRILSIDKDSGTITLTTEGTVNSVALKGATAYIFGSSELNKISENLYSNKSLGLIARSMTVEDLNKASGRAVVKDNVRYAWYSSDVTDAEFINVTAGGNLYTAQRHTANLDPEIDKPRFYTWDDSNGVTHTSTSEDDYKELKDGSEPILTSRTYYEYNPGIYNEKINKILGESDASKGWLASTYLGVASAQGCSYFGLRMAYPGRVGVTITYQSFGQSNALRYGVRPVIEIPINRINVEQKDKNGITVDEAWNMMGVGITGEEKVGNTLTANINLPTDYTVISKQWYSNDSRKTTGGAAIANATGDTYLLTSNEANKYIYVVVTAQKEDGTKEQFTAITTEIVKKLEVSVTLNMKSYTYGEEKAIPSVDGNTGNGEVTYYYNTTGSTSEGTNWSTVTSSTSLDAGTYYMYAVVNETGSYNGATTNVVEFKVNKKTIETNWGTQILFTYNGKSQAPTATATGATGETINVKVTGAQIDASGTAYTATASIESVTGGGANANNYTLTQTTKEFTISTKLVSAVWTNTSIEYTGGELVPTATAESGVDGETLSLAVTGATTLPGTYTATASIASVEGGQAKVDNYTLANTTTEFEITKGLMVGDYINHTTTEEMVKTDISKTGSDEETITTDTTAKWRVISIDYETGDVLVTTEGAVNSVTLKGASGYLYGASELNRLCERLYSNSTVGVIARSMTIEDLNKAVGYNPTTNSDYKKEYQYTTGEYYTYEENGVTITSETPMVASSSNEVKVKNTYYSYNPSGENSTIGSILVNNMGWLASPCAAAYPTYVHFSMHTVHSNGIGGCRLYNSYGGDNLKAYGLRPVISLNISQINTDDKTKNGITTDSAWNIMGVGITGEEKVGKTLTTNINLPTDYTVISKQWYSNDSRKTTGGAAIANATGDTYLLTSNEANKYVYVVVTAQKADGTTKQFTAITTESVKNLEITVTLGTTTYTYDGTAKEPAVTVKDGSTTLTLNTHYTVSYSNNVNAGTATTTITMKGNYSGTITKNFTIQKGTMSGNVTIKGTAKYGETLMVDTQNIVPNNSTSYSYIWWYSPSASATLGTKIDDSTNSNTYKIGDGLIDKYIGVTVTATNENYEEKTFTDITDTTENGEGKVIRISITKPTKTSKTYSYNGKNQTLELNNYDSSLMSITNNSSTNAGNFTAVISLKNNNYMWSDSTTSELNINWSIEKIANTLSVTAINNLKTTGGDLALVTASNAQGTVYYSIGTALTSSNYSSAGSTAIPTARTAGTYTIYYYTPGNTNYLEKSGNVQVTVTATTYTVTYNANGGSGAPANQSKILGTNLVLSSTVPTRSGYEFVSWNTKSDGTGTSYNAGGTYTQDAPLILYAIWKIKTVALSDTLYIGALSSYNNEPAATQTKTLELDLTNVKTLSFNTSGKWGYRNDIKATVSLIVNGTEYKKENIADGADNPVLHSFNWDVSSITGSATLQLYGYAKGGPAYYYGGKKFPAWQSNVGPLSVTDIVLNY